MATMNDSIPPRKRVATYGKAHRKRPQDYLTTSAFFDSPPRKELTKSSTGAAIPSPANPLPRLEFTKSPVKSSTSSLPSNIYDFPSDDDNEPSAVPPRKRKVADISTVKPKLKPVSKRTQEEGSVTPLRMQGAAPKASNVLTSGVKPAEAGHSFKPVPAEVHKSPKPRSAEVPVQAKAHKLQNPKLKAWPISQSHNGAVRASIPVPRTADPKAMDEPKISAVFVKPIPASRTRPITPVKAQVAHPSKPAFAPVTPPPQLRSENQNQSAPSPRSTPGVLTPRGMEMWDQLLSSDMEKGTGGGERSLKYNRANEISRAAMRPPRRRLIDSLVEQSNGSRPGMFSSGSEDEEMEERAENMSEALPENQSKIRDFMFDVPARASPKPIISNSQLASNVGTKVTYSRQRSMLAEQVLSDKMAFDIPLPESQPMSLSQRRGSIPVLAPLTSFHDMDEEEDSQVGGAIKTLHELRQAGANSRFADEVGDMLDQIGSPGPGPQLSRRRSGLLELAGRMEEKEFYVQFITLGMDQKLFVHLGKETDIVSGFLIVSILLRVLDNGITEITVTQLRRQGITRLLIRLLEVDTTIMTVAKDRKSNMSKMTQKLLAEHNDLMLKMKGWSELQPTSISPRTVALRSLEGMVRQVREAGNSSDIISKELTTKLFHLVDIGSEEDSTAILSHLRAVDFHLALSTLESHSLRAMTGSDESLWIGEFLPIIREILRATLRFSAKECGTQQTLALRLTLNVTNNNPVASNVFAKVDLMREVGTAMVDKFEKLAVFQIEEERVVLVDHLVLMLGVVINFAEWSERARSCFLSSEDISNNSVDKLVQIYVTNLDRMSEADSMEDSHRNVAFGYLSVFLGYLCLSPDLESEIRAGMRGNSLRPLIESVEEFISHHKKVDDLWEEDSDGHNPNAGLTQRLQEMVDKLKGI